MYIPSVWVRASGTGRLPDGRTLPTAAWGWGDDESTAERRAEKRLQNILDRLRRGEAFPEKYSYGDRPPREEILQVIEGARGAEPDAILTRNRHGVQVLNTARLLFLDIDVPKPAGLQRFLAGLGMAKDRSIDAVLARLRQTLRLHSQATFRIYRTAAGLRVMAVDREFDPTGAKTLELMNATGTDPAFIRLCSVQNSFRARLTPKPWRCNCRSPGIGYPRDADQQRQYKAWLKEYELAASGYATCRYLETVGDGRTKNFARMSIELHDRITRCNENLPLA